MSCSINLISILKPLGPWICLKVFNSQVVILHSCYRVLSGCVRYQICLDAQLVCDWFWFGLGVCWPFGPVRPNVLWQERSVIKAVYKKQAFITNKFAFYKLWCCAFFYCLLCYYKSWYLDEYIFQITRQSNFTDASFIRKHAPFSWYFLFVKFNTYTSTWLKPLRTR